jgi:hypothetical protein
MQGVLASSFPKQEKSPHPISSMKTRIKLGRSAKSPREAWHAMRRVKTDFIFDELGKPRQKKQGAINGLLYFSNVLL